MLIDLIGYEANIENRVGSNQYAFELMKALYQLDSRNQYRIFLPSQPLPDLPPERKNWCYQISGPKKFWNIFGVPCALYRQDPKPDVVFNPGHYSPLFTPSSLVISVMDLGYLRYPEQFTKPILVKLKFWTSFSIKRAAHIFSISQSTKNDIIKYYKIPKNRITVTYPGYDKRNFQFPISNFQTGRVKKKYKIKSDYILFLSTLKPNKNIEGFLKAFKLLNPTDLQLVIAGRKGWMFGEIFEKARQLELEDKVIFTGFVEEQDVPFLMRGSEVFVMPSFWEGFGIPVVEAMACGTPVVVANTGSLPEIVEKAGVVVDPNCPESIAEGMKKAIGKKSSLAKKGLKQAKKFSWQKCAQKTLEVLEKVGSKNV